jgi:hypothetical protein
VCQLQLAWTCLCLCVIVYPHIIIIEYCPHGQSWLSKPVENNMRNRNLVPCSNMGRCNEITGLCACRKGYEGRACERSKYINSTCHCQPNSVSYRVSSPLTRFGYCLWSAWFGLIVVVSCPTNLRFTEYQPLFNNGTFGLGRSLPFGRLPEDKDLRTEKALPVPICSGHGRCLTLRDAGLEFNGL